MTEKPFYYNQAFTNLKSNFLFHEDLALMLPKLIKKKGIINIGGNISTVLNFAKQFNKNIDKISAKKIFGKNYPLKQSMNIDLYKKAVK